MDDPVVTPPPYLWHVDNPVLFRIRLDDGSTVDATAAVSPAEVLAKASAASAIVELEPVEMEFPDLLDWVEPFAFEGLRLDDGLFFYEGVRGLDGAAYLLPDCRCIDELGEVVAEVDAARDSGGPVTWDDWETILWWGDLIVVSRRGDSQCSVTPVGRFDDPVEGLRAAAAASEYFGFDEATQSLVKLVEGYNERE